MSDHMKIDWTKADYAALKAENERLTKALSVMEAKKISLQDDALPKWINRAEAAERALAERAGGVKVPIGYALVPVEPTDRMVSAYVAAKPKGAGFNHPRKGDDKKAWFAAHEKKCRERWKAMLSVSTLTTEPAAPEGRQGVCATEGCDNHATNQFIRGGVGSTYCGDCFVKVIEACETTRPAEQAVTDSLVEALRDLLDCPDIADNDHKDEETHAAERKARAALSAALAQKEEGR